MPFVGSALLWQMLPKGVRGLELAPMLNVSFAHVMHNVSMAADSMAKESVEWSVLVDMSFLHMLRLLGL